MSRSSLGTLTLDLIAKTGGFETGMDRAARHSQRRTREMQRQWQDVRGTILKVGSALGVVFSAQAFARQIKGFIDEADRLSKAAQQIGVTTEALSGLEYAAQMSGVSAETLKGSLARLSQELFKARDGSAEAQKSFRMMQIEFTDAAGNLRASDEVLGDIADRFSRMQDSAEKTALAIRLFGRSAGPELIPLLNQGRDGIKDLRVEAERLGRVVSTETGRAAEEFNDNLSRLRDQSQRLTRQIASEMLPALLDLTNEFINIDGTATSTGQAIVDAFRRSVEAVTEFVRFVRWAGEQFAVFRFGIARDDIVRLEQEADRIRGILESGFISRAGQQLRFFGKDGIVKWYSQEELRAELAAIESQLETLYSSAPLLQPRAEPAIRDPFAPITEGAERAERATRRVVDNIGPIIASLQRDLATFGGNRADVVAYELAVLGASESQISFAVSLAESIQALDDNAKLLKEGSRIYEEMRTPVEQLSDRVNYLNDLLDAGAITWDTYARAIFSAQEAFDATKEKMKELDVKAEESNEKMSEFAIQAARNIQSAFADFLFDPFESGLRDMAANFARTLHRMVSELLAQKLLLSFFNAVNPSAEMGTALFGGARADGGPVSAGKAYLVGERGPELFVPGSAGNIQPNGAVGGVRIINVIDPNMVADYMNGPGGDQLIVNVLKRNAGSVRQVIA